jgi:phosphoribosylformylglycinamidine synthase
MILWGLGINCEEETEAAYTMAGAETVLVHVHEFLSEAYSIHDFQIIHFPGGFSFGDHLGAGRVLANRIRFKKTKKGSSFLEELLEFSRRGGFLFGICNGFQILVSLGLLPGFSDKEEAKISLVQNEGSAFQDRWVSCRFESKNLLSKLWMSDEIYLPIRHGEGRLFVSDESTIQKIEDHNLIAMTYSQENPNGSFRNCAALSDPSGRILGMMPHPEAFLSFYNNPQWCGQKFDSAKAHGLKFFENLIQYVRE